jgi:hypothetical protein
MIPESLNWPVNAYLMGGAVLAAGCLAALAGLLVRSRNSERHRDQLYVRRKRGEEPPPEEPPRIAAILQYVGGGIVFVGMVILVAAWSSAAGQH